MVRIPVYLATAQWALLLALGLLVIVMYRQLGHVFGPKATFEHGPAAGSGAPSFEYKRIADDTLQYVTPGNGEPALLAFVNPTCQACERLVSAFATAERAGYLKDLRVLLIISDPPAYLQVSEAFRTTTLEIGRVTSRATLNAYNAEATPLMVAIDSGGTVRAAGAAAKADEISTFVRACLLPPPDSTLPVVPRTTSGPHAEAMSVPMSSER
ncbi:MAG: hypothetical protein ACR2MP_12565 [Streptosporangiaceae bacterium]